MKTTQTRLIVAAVFALLVAGSIYFLVNRSSESPGEASAHSIPKVQEMVSLKWGGPKNISMLPLIATTQGFFAKYRLAAAYIDIQTGKKAMDALRTGDLDVGVLVDSNLAFAGYEQADDLRALCCIMT